MIWILQVTANLTHNLQARRGCRTGAASSPSAHRCSVWNAPASLWWKKH